MVRGATAIGKIVFYLWTVWEATRKDMRSPGDISLLEIKVPPANIVPRTMPVLRANNTKMWIYWISWETVLICSALCLTLNTVKYTHSSGRCLTGLGKLLFQHQDFHSFHMIYQLHMHITCGWNKSLFKSILPLTYSILCLYKLCGYEYIKIYSHSLKLPLLHRKSFHRPHVAERLICHSGCFCHLKLKTVKWQIELNLLHALTAK